MNKLLPVVLMVVLTVGCKKESQTNSTGSSVAGKFSVGVFSQTKAAEMKSSAESAVFNLDTLKTSRSFTFILNNIGQDDITNIKITSNNASFTVFPTTIDVLKGNKAESGIIQTFSLDIVHGMRINGVGYGDLLAMGDNTCTITISGQTTDSTNTVIDVSFVANIKVYAKVMAVALYKNGTECNFLKPDCSTIGWYGITMPTFNYASSDVITLKNTGNTPISLTLISGDAAASVLQSDVVSANDVLTLNMPNGTTSASVITYVQLDTDGTICDQNKLPLASNGNGYFDMIEQTNYVAPTPTPTDSTQSK